MTAPCQRHEAACVVRGEKLTARQQRFVDEYLFDLNGTQAAIRAGYSAKGADVRGAELLGNRRVSEAVAAAQAKRAERVQIAADTVLREWLEIARVDVRELIQYVRTSSADCWPDGVRDEANPECRKCRGCGRGHAVVADTRKLSPGAAKLYAGVQAGRDGIRVLLRDRDAAWINVARHLGMFPSKVELTGKDDGPVRIIIDGADAKL